MTMSKLDNLADIVFVDTDADEVESYVIGRYESITGRTLAKGDPVRLFLLTIAALIVRPAVFGARAELREGGGSECRLG